MRIRYAIPILALTVAELPAQSVSLRQDAPASVRIEIRSDSWLRSTPLELERKLVEKLEEASVVVESNADADADANVTLEYYESPDLIHPNGAQGTRADFRLQVVGLRGETRSSVFLEAGAVSPAADELSGTPASTLELQALAVERLEDNEYFAYLGHFVGAVLGLESSLRFLLLGPVGMSGIQFAAPLVFEHLQWGPGNDELFTRAATYFKFERSSRHSQLVERFVRERVLGVDQESRADLATPVESLLAAIDALASIGGRSAGELLEQIPSQAAPLRNPRVEEAVSLALNQIRRRLR